MYFTTNQLKIVKKLIDDRIYFLKENIFYCQNDLNYYSIKESEREGNKKAIAEAIKEKNLLIQLLNSILKEAEKNEVANNY
tara:strand:+ start:277 stop:519 length:243 start_codon:yes stop_codon:yes gene_type:complete